VTTATGIRPRLLALSEIPGGVNRLRTSYVKALERAAFSGASTALGGAV
jgi:hypothetical protein